MRPLLKLYTEEYQAETARLSAPPSLACVPVPANDDGAAPVGAQKRRRAPRRISLLSDRQFLSEYKVLKGIAQGVAPVQAGVSSTVSSQYAPTPPAPSPSYENDNEKTDQDDVPAFMTRAPAPWRYATDEVQGHFAFEALEALGPVVGFTAWCSAEISGKAYASGNPLPWLRKRIADALSKIGGVEFIAVLEEEWNSANGIFRLHLHGILGIDGSKRRLLAKVRKALRRAMGSWDGEARKRQIRFSHDLDCGWASYCTKRTWLALPGIRRLFASAPMHSSFRLSFDGPVMTMTNGVRELAKELHQEARRATQEARGRPIAVEVPQTTPEAAAPVSESLDAPAPASRSRSRPTTMPTTPLPIPAVAIRVPAIVLDGIWKASIGISVVLQGCPAPASRTSPRSTRALRPVLAVQVVPIATKDLFRFSAVARSRGPPRPVAETRTAGSTKR